MAGETGQNARIAAPSPNTVKDFCICFRANGPLIFIAWAIGPGPRFFVQKPVTRADGPGYWNGWPVGPESQAVSSMSIHLISQSDQYHHILHVILHAVQTEVLSEVTFSMCLLPPHPSPLPPWKTCPVGKSIAGERGQSQETPCPILCATACDSSAGRWDGHSHRAGVTGA